MAMAQSQETSKGVEEVGVALEGVPGGSPSRRWRLAYRAVPGVGCLELALATAERRELA
jgi:hypothetical protein